MANILVLAEHDNGQLKLATLSAVGFARKVVADAGGAFDILVIGENVGGTAEQLRAFGAANVMVADHAQLQHPVGDKCAHLVAEVAKQRGSTIVVGAASTFSKDILPRAAALLDAGMLSDVVDVHRDGDDFIFKRVLFAGNAIATVKLGGTVKFLTVRAAAFTHPAKGADASPVVSVSIEADKLPALVEYGGSEAKVAGRPDSTEARVVVSGGRGIKTAEDFERLNGGLADVLGGA
ncbi:MAG: electron transfer flavoprotein subunit alpha/FixB family protein, partial [Verrucomicrobiota bacterium]